jgi:hypothetical protein
MPLPLAQALASSLAQDEAQPLDPLHLNFRWPLP